MHGIYQFLQASEKFIVPETHAGLGYPVPITIMAQELGSHLRRCMAHEDVANQFTEQELEDAKQKWSCNSFQELQEEAEVWG